MPDQARYSRRGVSATKDEVHAAIKRLDKGLFPNAFCKILPDIVGGHPEWCNIMHADTAGTKTSLAYLYWRETGDLSVWEGIAQDALVMNLDDMACVGCTNHIVVSSTIGRNKHLIGGDVLVTLIQATDRFCDTLARHGIQIHLAGGETADVGDVVRTADVGYTTFARMRRDQLIINDIQVGDLVVGFASFGQATYEHTYNSGIGSNGLTSARHDVLHRDYAERFPESFDPGTPSDVVYLGSRHLTDTIEVAGTSTTVGRLLLSPTRTYLPVLKELFNTHRHVIHGLIHCTGGGQTKVIKFARGKRIVKDNLFPTPPVFQLIQQESGADWREMYQVFNMGHRMEVYLPPSEAAAAIEVAHHFGIEARIVGRVEAADKAEVIIEGEGGTHHYCG